MIWIKDKDTSPRSFAAREREAFKELPMALFSSSTSSWGDARRLGDGRGAQWLNLGYRAAGALLGDRRVHRRDPGGLGDRQEDP
ncbi:MAG: hypothetical protein R3D59_16505 [Paracoccaceae bacterium]